jgi:hypothetical protein
MSKHLLLAGLVAGLLASGAAAAPLPEGKPAKGKTEPAGVPLELRVVAKKASYPLDLKGLTPAEFRRQLVEAKEKGTRMPAPPAVDLVVELKNTSKSELKIKVNGDPVVLTLTLEGKGAVNVAPRIFFSRIFRVPRTLDLAPGATYTLPVKSLASGFRGQARHSYWTEPGSYELTASFRTSVSPMPEGAKKGAEPGWGQVTVTSAPVTIRVTPK